MADVDVLVVGAGPTGLSLACQLQSLGVSFRVVDRLLDRVHESRALAMQPRTLEVLAQFGVTQTLIGAGNPGMRLAMHLSKRTVSMGLFDIGIPDTSYPFILFISQAQTERILREHLAGRSVTIERGVELVGMQANADLVTCRLTDGSGAEKTVRTKYVVGCDGAHSTVRTLAGIGFEGSAYPQTFWLADLEVDGLEPNAVHAFPAAAGMMFFFPLGSPASWRMLAMRPSGAQAGTPTLEQLQEVTDSYASQRLVLHDPLWRSDFRIHLRSASHYQLGRVFVAGDAAHVHSPAGAQGMNTGIQDAINLGWKLALVAKGLAKPSLLQTYAPERGPVGKAVLRMSDRAFRVATSESPLVRFARTRVVPVVAPLALKLKAGRAAAFRAISELGIGYRRSPLSINGAGSLRRGPRAGDRLPDGTVSVSGKRSTLHAVVSQPVWHLLLCGPSTGWSLETVAEIEKDWPELVQVQYLIRGSSQAELSDPDGMVLRRLGLDPGGSQAAIYLVRPDGHIGYRSGADGLQGAYDYLNSWLVPVRTPA